MDVSFLFLLILGGGVLVLIGIGVAVFLLLTGKKDQRPSDRDERPFHRASRTQSG